MPDGRRTVPRPEPIAASVRNKRSACALRLAATLPPASPWAGGSGCATLLWIRLLADSEDGPRLWCPPRGRIRTAHPCAPQLRLSFRLPGWPRDLAGRAVASRPLASRLGHPVAIPRPALAAAATSRGHELLPARESPSGSCGSAKSRPRRPPALLAHLTDCPCGFPEDLGEMQLLLQLGDARRPCSLVGTPLPSTHPPPRPEPPSGAPWADSQGSCSKHLYISSRASQGRPRATSRRHSRGLLRPSL